MPCRGRAWDMARPGQELATVREAQITLSAERVAPPNDLMCRLCGRPNGGGEEECNDCDARVCRGCISTCGRCNQQQCDACWSSHDDKCPGRPTRVESAPANESRIDAVESNDKGPDVSFSSQGPAAEAPQAYVETTWSRTLRWLEAARARRSRTGGESEVDTEVLPMTRCPPAGQGVGL